MTWIVKDRYTHNVIFTGTKEDCLDFVRAFGLCYAEEQK